jgi:hypothetical protein
MKTRWRKERLDFNHEREKTAMTIVGDGAIATSGVVEGAMIPVVIVDTNLRPDIDELIRVHEYFSPGDVEIQWGREGKDKKIVSLYIFFQRPVEAIAIINFDISRQGILVEQILATRAFYLQAGRLGDRVSETLDNPKIAIDVPDTGFRTEWDRLFLKSTVSKMRAQGLSRHQSKQVAKDAINEIRKISEIRVP